MSNNILTRSILSLRLPSFFLVLLSLGATLVSGESVPTTSATYFKANGTQPVWNLEIAEDQITFHSSTIGFEQFILPHAEPLRSENGQNKTYKVKSREVEMVIEITDKLCENPNSHERFPFSVTVSLRRISDGTPTVFSGCGLYVPDNRLHGRWIVETIKSTPVPDSLFHDQPLYLELAVDGSYFTSFAGCNMISGRLFFERSLLRFTDFVIPKDKCDQISFEKNIISALQFTTTFSILRDELMLGNPTETTLKLRKEK